jgi:shikimate dehydrogenase
MHASRFEVMPIDLLPRHAIVTDIVYVPLVTPLLADAQAIGLRTVDGLGMLLHQAVPGFEAWFGVRPEVTAELRAKVEATL